MAITIMIFWAILSISLSINCRVFEYSKRFLKIISRCLKINTKTVINRSDRTHSHFLCHKMTTETVMCALVSGKVTSLVAFLFMIVSSYIREDMCSRPVNRVSNVVSELRIGVGIVTVMTWYNKTSIFTTSCN
jgi:hypothetical protein